MVEMNSDILHIYITLIISVLYCNTHFMIILALQSVKSLMPSLKYTRIEA